MRVTEKKDIPETGNERTVYTVEIGDGRTVNVVRRHYFPWRMFDEPLVYVMEPHDEDISCGAVIRYLRENVEEFGSYVLERQSKSSQRKIRDVCCGPEQAEYLAGYHLKNTDINRMRVFRILRNNSVVRDYLKEAEDAGT